MKKSNLIVIGLVAVIFVIAIIGIKSHISKKMSEKDTYSNIIIDNYQIKINDKYKYEYDEINKEGHFNNEMFEYSYIYLSDTKYGELITSSSYYTNMGAKELDTDIEEVSFGGYEAFINEKKVLYEDVNKEYHLVLILIKVSDDKTFVVQYELSYDEDYEELLEDVKLGLKELKKVK